jgi:hypothetical protein
LAQQDGPESASLKIVCDREGNLRPLIRDGHLECVAHHTLLVATACNQSKGLVKIRFSVSFGSQRGAILKSKTAANVILPTAMLATLGGQLRP